MGFVQIRSFYIDSCSDDYEPIKAEYDAKNKTLDFSDSETGDQMLNINIEDLLGILSVITKDDYSFSFEVKERDKSR